MAEIILQLNKRKLDCQKLAETTSLGSRDLNNEDFAQFQRWTETYRNILQRHSQPDELLQLGRELYAWLDGDQGWLERLKQTTVAPLIVEFSVDLRPDAEHQNFVHAPWELLADTDGHWARRSDLAYTPLRRLGERQEPLQASPYRLSTVFMAASPKGAQVRRFGKLHELRFEEEEAAIVRAAGTVGMDLVVEESGTLSLLEETLSFEKHIDVVHISCHGTTEPEPCLLLEDEYGERKPETAKDIVNKVRPYTPKLLFLSACETNTPGRAVNALAVDVVLAGLSAVLGWAGSVDDSEATQFAEELYHRLALGHSLPEATGDARRQLLEGDGNPQTDRPSRDWHLARLYLGPNGGGKLSSGKQARKRDANAVHKAFLDEKNSKVPVAAPHEFVGRRRQIQQVLQAFRQDGSKGVFVHGVGRQGKSSLAARIALRMAEYKPVVLYGKYDELSILNAFGNTGTDDKLRDFLDSRRQEVQAHPERFAHILRELLENHFSGLKKDENTPIIQQPTLLIVDDFEQVLEERPGQAHRIKQDILPAIRGVLLAFRNARTASRLLFTSRYTFSLTHDGRDLAADLSDLHLPPMEEYEAQKQASAKLRSDGTGQVPSDQKEGEGGFDAALLSRIIQAALGNPGLQDMLFRLAVENTAACDEAVTELQAFIDSGQQPNQEKLLAFLEDLAINRILDLLTSGEKKLLRVSTIFELPIPVSVFESFCGTAGFGKGPETVRHLLGLGVWDRHEDVVQANQASAALNPLVRPLAGQLEETERKTAVTSMLLELHTAWGGADGVQRLTWADYELARLALIVEDAQILRETVAGALAWLINVTEHRKAAELGKQAIACLDEKQEPVSADLLRVSGEQADMVGDVGFARECFSRAVKFLENTDDVDPIDLGAVLLAQGRRLVNEGQPDDALAVFQKVQDLFGDERFLRERAVTLGDIARIQVSKGQVDEALKLP